MLHRRECPPVQGNANHLRTVPILVMCVEANTTMLSLLSPCLISNVAMSFNDNDEKNWNLQISFISPALVNKDVYYNTAKKKVSFGGQPNMERFCGKQVPIIWKSEPKEASACVSSCLSVALGFLCIELELQAPDSHPWHVISLQATSHPGSCSASPSPPTLIPTSGSNP